MLPIVIFAVIALVAAAGFWRWKRRAAIQPTVARTTRLAKRFSAVEIQPRSVACEAARAIDGQRFLANDAPALPLAGCTAARCGCRFVKLSDRRSDNRRSGHEGLSASVFLSADRREQDDRRHVD